MPPIQVQEFPKMKYHREKAPLIVQDEIQEARLGEDWKDSPADHGYITHPEEHEAAVLDPAHDKVRKHLGPHTVLAREEQAEGEGSGDAQSDDPKSEPARKAPKKSAKKAQSDDPKSEPLQ